MSASESWELKLRKFGEGPRRFAGWRAVPVPSRSDPRGQGPTAVPTTPQPSIRPSRQPMLEPRTKEFG